MVFCWVSMGFPWVSLKVSLGFGLGLGKPQKRAERIVLIKLVLLAIDGVWGIFVGSIHQVKLNYQLHWLFLWWFCVGLGVLVRSFRRGVFTGSVAAFSRCFSLDGAWFDMFSWVDDFLGGAGHSWGGSVCSELCCSICFEFSQKSLK